VLEEPPLYGNLIKEETLDGLLSEIVPDAAYKSTMEMKTFSSDKKERAY